MHFYIPVNNNGKGKAVNLRGNDGVRGPWESYRKVSWEELKGENEGRSDSIIF